jgi:hypothetical protein
MESSPVELVVEENLIQTFNISSKFHQSSSKTSDFSEVQRLQAFCILRLCTMYYVGSVIMTLDVFGEDEPSAICSYTDPIGKFPLYGLHRTYI